MTQYNDLGTLVSRLKNLEERMSVAEGAPRLSYSSIQNGGITEYDINGNPVARYGQQWDGTHTAASLSGPIPPVPTNLAVNPVVGGLEVIWAGTFEGLVPVPMDYSRVEIHIAMVDDFDITPNNLLGTIESPQGGVQFFALAADTTYYVRLATRSQSGKISAGSATVSGTPLPAAGEAVIPIPDEPVLTSVTSSWAYNASYLPKATFTVNFAGVNVDTTGAPLTPVAYELWVKKTSESDDAWSFASSTALSSFQLVGLDLSTSYSFKVRAISAVAAGGFSNVLTQSFSSGSVVETVPTPAGPSVSSRLGLIEVFFIGLTASANQIPPHVARVDVYASTDGVNFFNFGDILGPRAAYLNGYSAGDSVTVKLKAVSVSGVESAFSTSQTRTVIAVVSGDLANSSVTAGKIAANAVVAGTVVSGAIDGLIITGAIFRTAPSGQRVHIDTTGLKAYNNLDQVVTQISAADGKLSAVGGSFSGEITATSGTISGSLSLSGQVVANSYATVSGELVRRVTLKPAGLLLESFVESPTVPEITTNITLSAVYTGILQIGTPEYYTPGEFGDTGTIGGYNTVIRQDNLTNSVESVPTAPSHYSAKIEQASYRPSFQNPDSAITGVDSTTTWSYYDYTNGSHSTVLRSQRAHLGVRGLHFVSFGSGLSQPNITSNQGLKISSTSTIELAGGVFGVIISKDASNLGNLEVRNNLKVEGTSNFLGAITAPGGVGGLPVPTADSAAATKKYVDDRTGGDGSSFVTLRASSDVAASLASTTNALTLGSQFDVQTKIGRNIILARTVAGAALKLEFPTGITALPTPSASTDAATKGYVDGLVSDTGWFNLVVGNSWVSFGGAFVAPRYRRVNGQVYVQGTIKSGSTGVIATLPVGCRPSATLVFITPANAGVADIRIATNGEITVFTYYAGGSNGIVGLNLPPFPADL